MTPAANQGGESIAAVLRPHLARRTVALVGNAHSILDQQRGMDIDRCDVVIRLNGAPQMAPESHGRRTTLLFTSSLLPVSRVRELQPQLLLWMSPKQRVRAAAAYGLIFPLQFYPRSWWDALKASIGGSRPSTGLMAIDLLLRIDSYTELSLFGFDFFQSQSLSVRQIAVPPPHDFVCERARMAKFMEDEPRLRLVTGRAGCKAELACR